MGRSVSTPSDAVEVLYLSWYPDEDTIEEMVADHIEANEITDLCRHDREALAQDLIAWEWDYVTEDFVGNVLQDLFPSIEAADDWIGNENHVVAENRLARFGVSEYAGLAALWVVPVTNSWGHDYQGLSAQWISQAWPKIEAMYPHRLGLMGRFSNGEAVYQRVEQ
jgi:hypothetical protein